MSELATPISADTKRNGLNRLKLYAYAALANYGFSAIYSLASKQQTTFLFMLAAAVCVLAALFIGIRYSLLAGQLMLVTLLNANIFAFCYNAGLMGSSYMFFYPVLIASVFLVGFDKLNWQIYYVIACTTFFLALTVYLSGEWPQVATAIKTIRSNRTANLWIVYALMVTFVIILVRLKFKSDQKLFEAIQRAEEAARAKTQFLSVMSHELRTPLNGIIGISHLLQIADTEELKREYLRLLQKSADHMQKMVGDILDYNKMDVNRLELHEHAFNLQAFFEGIQQQFQQQFEQAGLYFKTDVSLPSPHLMVNGDEVRLAQVLYNLLGNALKFTKTGGVLFSMHVNTTGGQAQIDFAVEDTGVGIEPEDRELIFKEFQQGAVTRRHKLGGTGLGLSISKQLLQLMKSDLRVTSEQDKGSRFYFTLILPLATEAAPMAEAPASGHDLGHLNLHALVVEDNRVNAMVVTSMLKRWNVRTDLAVNGREALARLSSQHYDVVLMDIEMPEMDGYAATAAIRSNNATLPVIALTATLMEKETMQRLKQAGFTAAVSKPFKPDDLFAVLQKFVGE